MKLSFRWYGKDDPVSLEYIKQIPGMTGIVSAIYDVPVGEVWPLEKIKELKSTIEKANLELAVIESVPVHEEIKLGLPTRDYYIENYKQTLRNLGEAGINTVCYNFMPVFDWTRSSVDKQMADGSLTLNYENNIVEKMDPVSGDLDLPGWATNYNKEELASLIAQFKEVTDDKMWENLAYFLEKVVPCAEESDVKLAIHPDDPPWPIFSLPRIIKDKASLEKVVGIVDSPSNGLTICSGSLGADSRNDLPDIIRTLGGRDKINFLHLRNIKRLDNKDFEETAHLSNEGSLDMYEILGACVEVGYNGPIRPDHGRMIWGEQGRPGYGLYDRALGATYINGLLEAINKQK